MNTDGKNPQQNNSKMNSRMYTKDNMSWKFVLFQECKIDINFKND